MSSPNPPPVTENEFDAATFSNSIPPHLKENEFDASSFSNLNQHMNNNHHSPKPPFEAPNMKSLEANESQDEYEDAQASEGLSDNEVLLDQTFRVWGQGQGLDYHVVLTPVSLKLQPTNPDPDTLPPPVCCICPPMKCCGNVRPNHVCCKPKPLELLGRDIIACYPANHQLHQKPDSKSKNRGEEFQGYPVFMVIAYPANRNKKGKRKRFVLHFHLMPDSRMDAQIDAKRRIRTESVGTEAPNGEVEVNGKVKDDKEQIKQNKHRMMTMFAAKLRDTWVHAITTTLFPDDAASGASGYPSMPPGEGKRLLVIINPFAGTKQAQVVANRSIFPMLQQAGVEYEVLLTSYAGHARELVRQEASDRWKGIVVVSGDGLMYEVLNGLFDREDWREALECLSFGIVPAGSGNGLSRSLSYLQREKFHLGTQDLSAAVNCARGSVRPMDLLYVETPMNGRLSFHSVFWGLVADVDIESEVLRWMGGVRYTIWSLLKVIKPRRYRARLSYIPCDPDYTEDTRQILDDIHHKDPEIVSNPDESSSEDSNMNDNVRSQNGDDKNSLIKEDNDIENDSLASEKPIAYGKNKKRHISKSSSNQYSRYNNKYNSTSNTVDHEDDMSLPHSQPPGTYLTPRYVTYGTMLAQGQLYDRSWQELQASIQGIPSNKVHPMDPYGYHQMPPPELVPPPLHSSQHSLSCPQHSSQRVHPNMHPQQLLGEPSPSKNGHSKHRLKQQMSTSSSSYCTAAAALKRAEDQTRPRFKDMPGILDPIPTDSDLWVTEEGSYLGAMITNVPYIATDFLAAPNTQIDDNQLCLIIFRGYMTQKNLLKTLIKIEKGKHIGIPGIEIIPVNAVRIEPLENDKNSKGMMTVDGELIESGPLQCHIMQNAAKVYSK